MAGSLTFLGCGNDSSELMWLCLHYNDSSKDTGLGFSKQRPSSVKILQKERFRVGDICSQARDILTSVRARWCVSSVLLGYCEYHCWVFSGSQILIQVQLSVGFRSPGEARSTFMVIYTLPTS